MLNGYLLNLYKQYCDAKGIVFKPIHIENISYEFLEWITINKLCAKEYRDYLLYLGYHNSKSIAEIDKGRYDSIAFGDIEIISPYAYTLNLPNAQIFFIEGIPFIEKERKILLSEKQVLLTHNPYDLTNIQKWINIHNLGRYDISIGMYGSIHDENYSKKIKCIEDLAKKMNEDYTIEYDTDKDKYFCSLNSKRKVKIKILKK